MNNPAKVTSAPEIDSAAAVALAAVEGDFSYLSPQMRERVEDGFRRMTDAALASGEPQVADWEDIKRRVRERLRIQQTQSVWSSGSRQARKAIS